MRVKVERDEDGDPSGDAGLSSAIALRIRSGIMVSPEMEIVDYGALPRSERKSKRIFDNRE